MAPVNKAPGHDPDVWLFDLDNTLYPARCNLFAQIDVRIGRYVADLLKVDAEEARRVQKQYWREHGTSLRGMMTLHGVDPTHFLDFVHDIDYSPVEASPALEASLRALPGRKIIFTAGDVPHAERVMERLGVAHHFEAIFDIAAGDYWPKPHKQIYEKLVVKHGVDPTRACMADDIAINLKPAGDMGMRTVWIRTEESVKRAGDLDLSHIHHETDDLATWLAEWIAERKVQK
jgi:putative hydrolase of the HAD superfamily